MGRFPGPLAWFQRKFWRLKWLEFIVLFLVFVVALPILDRNAFGGLGVGGIVAGVIGSPLGGLMLWAMFKMWAFMFRLVAVTAWLPRLVGRLNDRLLATMCAKPIVFIEIEEY